MAADEGQSLQNYMLGEIANLVSMIPALKASTEHGTYGSVLAAMDDMLTQMRPGEDGPVLRITADQALYPQYNLEERLREWRRSPEVTRWLADQARAHLAEDRGTPNVRAHWRWLAMFDPGAPVGEPVFDQAIDLLILDTQENPEGHPCRDCNKLYREHPHPACEGWR